MQRHALDEAASVHEDQRRPVGTGQLGDPVIDLAPLLVGADRAQLVPQYLDRQIQIAPLADVDDGGQGTVRADEQSRRRLDGPHRGRQPDALGTRATSLQDQVLEALEGERQVRAALVTRHRVDLVHDYRARSREAAAARFRRQENVQGLGRGDEHVRRTLRTLAALGRRGVSRANGGTNGRRADPHLGRHRRQLAQRLFQVAADVVGERLERRDVDDLGPVFGGAVGRLAHEGIEAVEEGGERLARPRRSREQDVPSVGDGGPAQCLHGGGLGEAPPEPGVYDRMEHAYSIVTRAKSYTTGGRYSTERTRPPSTRMVVPV